MTWAAFRRPPKGYWGNIPVEHYPDDIGWAGALNEALMCSDEEEILKIEFRPDRFARREPGFLGETVWRNL